MTVERRQNDLLRSMFDDALVMIEPFFNPTQGWAGQALEHLAYRIVRENFPSLSGEETHALVVAAHRLYLAPHPASVGPSRQPGAPSRSDMEHHSQHPDAVIFEAPSPNRRQDR